MHELLFHRQKALEDGDLRGYAAQLGLDVAAFDRDRASSAVADRIRRDDPCQLGRPRRNRERKLTHINDCRY